MNPPEYIPDPEMPILKSELVGRIVRTRVTVERRDKFLVRPGTLCKVSGWFRGLSIEPLGMPGQSIRRVPLIAVELMKKNTPDQ